MDHGLEQRVTDAGDQQNRVVLPLAEAQGPLLSHHEQPDRPARCHSVPARAPGRGPEHQPERQRLRGRAVRHHSRVIGELLRVLDDYAAIQKFEVSNTTRELIRDFGVPY